MHLRTWLSTWIGILGHHVKLIFSCVRVTSRSNISNLCAGQQYFHLNTYRPTTGKRAFQAKVTKNFANGYTIETVIDGKPLRGILFSTSSSTTNPDPDG